MKASVLFVCAGNSARSQMAEAFLRRYGGDYFEVFSAGLEPNGVHPLTIRVMEEAGFDMSAHTSKPVARFLGKRFEYVITVCSVAEKNCPVFPGVSKRLYWPFDDPTETQRTKSEQLEKFRRVRDEIAATVIDWLAQEGF